MALDDVPDQGQPQPSALIERHDAIEGLKNDLAMLFGDAGATVGYAERAISPYTNTYRAPLAAVNDGILDKVDNRARQCGRVSSHHYAVRLGIEGDVVARRYSQGRHFRGDLRCQIDQVDRLEHCEIRVQSLQVKQLVGQICEAGDVKHEPAAFLSTREQFDAGLEDGNRRAQLMGRIGKKALPTLDAVIEALQRGIDRPDQGMQLVGNMCRRQADTPPVDIDLVRLRRHIIDPAQLTRDDRGNDDEGNHSQQDQQATEKRIAENRNETDFGTSTSDDPEPSQIGIEPPQDGHRLRTGLAGNIG